MIDYMSLFPKEDILTKEIESWKCFVSGLSSKENRESFNNMLNDCYKYAAAINAKGQPFPTELLFMALLLSQNKVSYRSRESWFQSITHLIKRLRNPNKKKKT